MGLGGGEAETYDEPLETVFTRSVLAIYTDFHNYVYTFKRLSMKELITLDIGTRLFVNAAFIRIHVMERFSKDFLEVREFWLSSRNFFQGGKIYCYANFFCYAIVFGPNFREGQKFLGGQTASGGCPPAPLWKKARVERSRVSALADLMTTALYV